MATIPQTKSTTASDGDHYYTAQGDPAYGAGIRIARAEGLLPSPSTILGVMNKPGIAIWMQNQAIETALDMAEQVQSHYTDRKDQVKAIADATKERNKAPMELGTLIHSKAERILEGGEAEVGEPYSVGISDYVTQHILRTRWCEKSVMHIGPKIAFAGRVDALVEHQSCGLSVLDWKSSKVARGKTGNANPKWYDPYIIQLSAYSYAIDGQPQPISVAINTTPNHEGEVYEKIWEQMEIERGWRIFNLLYRLWCEEKKYSPHEFYLNR